MFNLLRGIAQEASLTYQEADTRHNETIRGKRICNRGSSARKGKALVTVVTVKMERAGEIVESRVRLRRADIHRSFEWLESMD